MWLRIKASGEFLFHGNEPLDSIQGGEFLDKLRDY
jgi:hypothetical protein